MKNLELISCPLCAAAESVLWAAENGYKCVRCSNCDLLYVNPRPKAGSIDTAIKLGAHQFDDGSTLNTKTRRVPAKRRHAENMVRVIFADFLEKKTPIKWLDVGAGHGEFVSALMTVLPEGSDVQGLEPMPHKVEAAVNMGLPIKQGYIDMGTKETYHVVSSIDVFSHIPDFSAFLFSVKHVLRKDGEFLLKTGNAADIGDRRNFPGPLNLPDHLVFGGVSQITCFLENAGFYVVSINEERIDGLWHSFKNALKWLLHQPVALALPYTSPTRTLWMRAKLKESLN